MIDKDRLASLSSVKIATLAYEARESAQLAMHEPIAIVGMACRYPGGATNPEEFWQFLVNGGNGIVEMPKERFDADLYFDENRNAPGKMYVKKFGLLKQDIKAFDAEFFGIAPREAGQIDPQQRLLMECTWAAIEDACISPTTLRGSNTGVFVGMLTPDYYSMIFSELDKLNAYSATGTSFSIGCGRISYFLGLMGPSMTAETACSSSLVALHNAVQALRLDECKVAIVGGVNAIVSPSMTIACCKASMLAADGQCKTFDAAADGYVRGEGVGVIVLKKLSDALVDGDRIHALVRGSAVNHGGKSPGLTAPNSIAQESCIRQALKSAGLTADQVDFVETHGTGTSLGDPIEIQALSKVYGEAKDSGEKYVIGAVKTNVGHLESGAGVAGVIKAVLSLKNGEIPKHLNFKKLNPHINLEAAKATIPLENTPWPSGERRRFAGVSSFGFGGTNAHVILEEAPVLPKSSNKSSVGDRITLVSARNPVSLKKLAGKYVEKLTQDQNLSLDQFSYIMATGRSHFSQRLAILADTKEKLIESLKKFVADEPDPKTARGALGAEKPQLCFLFSGQGSQYSGMGRDLFESEPVFRASLERSSEILKSMDIDLMPLIFESANQDKLNLTLYTQPALFAFEYALAQLWMSWGVKPTLLIGHSLGEYVAACVAEVFSLEDGLKFVIERARLMNSLPPGTGMSALMCTRDRALEILKSNQLNLEFASYNAREQVVMAGNLEELKRLGDHAQSQDIVCRSIPVSHGFHSKAMDPILDKFEQLAASIESNLPRFNIVSNLTGKILEQAPDSKYWRDHLKSPVMFEQGARFLEERGCKIYLEIGPHATLTNLIKQIVREPQAAKILPTMRKGVPSKQLIAEALGVLYCNGVEPDWNAYYLGREEQKTSLPTYEFDHTKTHWYVTNQSK